MAMARMTMAMTRTRMCCLSGFSALSDGTHHLWEEGGGGGGGMSKPLWSLEQQQQQEPPLPSGGGGGGIQDDRPAYYDCGNGGGIQDDRTAYYDDCGIQDYRRGIQDESAAYRAAYYADPATIYYGDFYPKYPDYYRKNPLHYYEDRAAYFGNPPPYCDDDGDDGEIHDARPTNSDYVSDDDSDDDSPPPYSPPPYSLTPPPPPPPPSDKYVDMGLLRPWRLPDAHSDGTPPAQRWWEVEFKKPWRLPPSGTPGVEFDDRPAPQLSMVGSNSNWEGRLKRFNLGRTFRPYPNYSLEDCVALRVYSIAQYFKYHPESPDISKFPEQFEYWLDDVQGYFEFMELAHELHSIDCLYDLLHYVLVYPRAAFRAKTAELVTTMVHNNPRSQQLVMELNGLDPLWYNFIKDPNATSRTKALGAISALIRNNKPGITAFRERDGYAALGDALSSENVWFQREALNLILYLLHENSSDCNTVTELGLPLIMMHLASSDDAEVRVAALGGLLVLARDEGGNSGQLLKNDDKLKQVLQKLMKRFSAMAAKEEIQLVESLWNAVDPKLPIETMLV